MSRYAILARLIQSSLELSDELDDLLILDR
jgi:hypothetical protein